MVDFFHQCSERNKKAIYGTPNARASCMSWKNLVPSKCHKWNTTPPSLYPPALQCVLQNGQRRAAKNGTYVKPGGGQRRKNS